MRNNQLISRLVRSGQGLVCVAALAACGGDDGGTVAPTTAVCSNGERSTVTTRLPMEAGNVWRYRVIDVATSAEEFKRQEMLPMVIPDGETEAVHVQQTSKTNGTAVSWFEIDGDAIYRLNQIDYDTSGDYTRRTLYEPRRVRLDESTVHTLTGAEWTDSYTEVEFDEFEVEVRREEQADVWKVEAQSVACPDPWSEWDCLHLRRTTAEVDKQFWFAEGVGKIREEGGSTLEELVDCELQLPDAP